MAIISSYFCSSTITNNTIIGNSSTGIYCYSSSPTIYNNIITENGSSSPDYYGIHCSDQDSNPTIDYDDVWNNGLSGNNNYYYLSHQGHDISGDRDRDRLSASGLFSSIVFKKKILGLFSPLCNSQFVIEAKK